MRLAIGLLSRVLPGPATLLLVGFLAAGVSLFLGTLEFIDKSPRQRLAQLVGLFLLVYALMCWYGALSGQGDPLKPGPGQTPSANQGSAAQPASQWLTVSTPAQLDAALAQAKAAGQPLLLDWYADWCISCKVIEHEVLNNPRVLDLLKGYQLVRFDITASNPEQRALLDRYQLFGPPALIFFDKKGSEISDQRVIGEINAQDFAERVVKANDQI